MRCGFILCGERDVSSLGLTGDVGLELVGKEKLTDPLLPGLSKPVSSSTLDKLVTLDPGLLRRVAVVVGPRLDPRPLALFGGGDVMRAGGSRLAVRRCTADKLRVIFFGMAGTGGASAALGTGRAGEGSRKVRSDIDPLLPRRSRV
jgi:Fe2+ transport system protein FeoA